MELRHLRYFVAVAEELHFRRAAERLHIAQPAVSEQVRKLEAELGVRLLDRNQRSVSLTVSGTAFLEEARRVLDQAERAVRAARRARSDVMGRLRLGYLVDALPVAVPRALRRFAAAAPGIDVQLERDSCRRLLADVASGQLDAAVVCLPAPLAGLRANVFDQETAVAAMADVHACASEAIIALGLLRHTPIMVLARDVNPAFHDAIVAECWRTGAAPGLVQTGDRTIGELLLGVTSGGGIALLPSSVADRHAMPGVRFKALAAPVPTCDVALVSRPDNASAPLAAFQRMLGERARSRPRLAAVA
jgi:DNA-binding transcriptional LysR family regulator